MVYQKVSLFLAMQSICSMGIFRRAQFFEVLSSAQYREGRMADSSMKKIYTLFLLSFHVTSKGLGSTPLPCLQNRYQKILVYSTSNYLRDEISHILVKRKWQEAIMRTLSFLTQMKLNFEFSKIYDSPQEKEKENVNNLYSEMSNPTRLPLEIVPLSTSYAPFTHCNRFLFPNWLLSKRTGELICVNCKKKPHLQTYANPCKRQCNAVMISIALCQTS